MPTLLQINVTANSGSHGKIAEEIGVLAMSRGWRSVIAYGRWANPSKSELIRIGSDVGVKEHAIESRLLDNHGLASRKDTRDLVQKIKEIKPDIIHLHNIHGYYLNYRILFEYLNKTNIPVVWTFHDCWPFTGHCAHFVTAKCEKWREGCFNCPLLKDYPKSFSDHSKKNYQIKKEVFTANNNLHIVAVSDWLAGLVRQSFFKDKDIRVIKNGVNLDIFKPSFFEGGVKNRIIGVSNVWTKDKGLQDFYSLRERLNQDAYEIILVGLNVEQIKSLPQGIKGIEHTESLSELVTLYSSASVLVNPTYADTFPTINLEALACGTPVITYRTGGSPEAVDKTTGIVVEQGNLEELTEAITEICRKDRDSISKACRMRAVQEFNKNDKYNGYLSVYQQVMGGVDYSCSSYSVD